MALSLDQLMAETVLELSLATPTSHDLLKRAIRWVASTELVDPSPFLRGGELLLTTGACIQADDQESWQNFVHRLKRKRVAAIGFGCGLTHADVPRALVESATAVDLPVLSVPYNVPFVRISEFVAEMTVADRFKDMGRASNLAAELAQLMSNSAPLTTLLRRIAKEIGGEAAILDIDGKVVSTWPLHQEWQMDLVLQGLATSGTTGYHAVPLDQAGAHDHMLVGHTEMAVESVRMAMSAAATLVAIDLTRRLQEEPSNATRMAAVLASLTDWTTPTSTLVRALRVAGLRSDVPTVVLLAAPKPAFSAGYSLRLRLAVEQVLPVVRSVRSGELLVLLAQGGTGDTAGEVLEVLRREMPGRAIVVAGPARDAEEIRMVLASARAMITDELARPQRSRPFDLTSIVAAAAGRGGQHAAREVLRPLIDHDSKSDGQLMHTLSTYLRLDARQHATAEALHVHRNTLRYRLAQIGKLLEADLDSLDTLVICNLAFRLYDAAGH
ncbi:Carbohydrate diacid regulator [Nonomuraea coxensis DSM 45129]|uniref:Carbohydrate diacid regulator n=1 Tax=Nonomuraea coxensis DSM 45129 TaxID=1122611 RepID=A0ABX8UBE1_9ACTN|nr:PucR family transcriptional regulator [Nonomuraea coxensis]QYC44281.1 Carbohydrate diacid regulator [Nonomuraea coxensis DSM 45129]